MIFFVLFLVRGTISHAQTTDNRQLVHQSLEAEPLIRFPTGTYTLGQIMDTIEMYTGFAVYCQREALIPGEKFVVTNEETLPLYQALDKLLAGHPLKFLIAGRGIAIKRRREETNNNPPSSIKVFVKDESGQPLPGATLRMENPTCFFSADKDGMAVIKTWGPSDTVWCTHVEKEPRRVVLSGKDSIEIMMLPREPLDLGTVTIYQDGYHEIKKSGSTTADLNTIQVSYNWQGSNLSAMLAGRVAGLLVTQKNGVLGSDYSVLLRGKMSILNGNEPLYIIDEVPFAPGNQSVSNISTGNSAGGLNPLSFLDMASIEKIEVLKDADATAIYGSRGGNGVIRITTRHGTQGEAKWNVGLSQGISSVTRLPRMMNIREYIVMRREALQNDGLPVDAQNAPDIVQTDTTRSTDWSKYFIGGMGQLTHAQGSLTGGDRSTNYFLGASYFRETNVFLTHPADDLITVTGNIEHHSLNKKLTTELNFLLGWDRNQQFITDLTRLQFLAPNAIFSRKLAFDNPLSFIHQPYTAHSRNTLIGHKIFYRIDSNFSIRNNIGLSEVDVNESSTIPASYQDPPADGRYSAHTSYRNCILEFTGEYRQYIGQWKVDLAAGASWQENSLPAVDDRYYAVFTDFNLKWKDKYLLHLTGRNDYSTRFGPDKQSGNFGSAGFAWIFSKEPAFRQLLPFVSFGKLRGSYGVMGNDQLDERYKYVNGSVAWEGIVKQEAAMDLELFNGRLSLTSAWYRNRSLNQLLPGASGQSGTLYNLPVVIQNKGWEFSLTSTIIRNKDLTWTMSLNASLPVNKMVAFPGLTSTLFSRRLTVGQSVESVRGYRYLGVDPGTGLFQFKDMDGDGRLTDADKETAGHLDPVFFGGLLNTFSWKRWQLSMLIEGRIQQGMNYQAALYAQNPPGMTLAGLFSNETRDLVHRWRQPGDRATYQRLTTDMGSAAGRAISSYLASSAMLTNASFLRLKYISLSYKFPESKKIDGRIFLQGQNLLTLAPYKGADPETQNILALPPLKSIILGLDLKF
jgi:TonB-dependent SusC/RagA subfamily outer membrane receptor